MFKNDSTHNYYKEISLPEILQIVTNIDKSRNNNNPFTYIFEVKTQNLSYYVGDDSEAEKWEKALRQAWMPVLTTSGSHDYSDNIKRGSLIMNNGTHISNDENQNQSVDISQQFQIFVDDVLGAGQFGTVLFACLHTLTINS